MQWLTSHTPNIATTHQAGGHCVSLMAKIQLSDTHPREEDAAPQEQQLVQLGPSLAADHFNVRMAEILLLRTQTSPFTEQVSVSGDGLAQISLVAPADMKH